MVLLDTVKCFFPVQSSQELEHMDYSSTDKMKPPDCVICNESGITYLTFLNRLDNHIGRVLCEHNVCAYIQPLKHYSVQRHCKYCEPKLVIPLFIRMDLQKTEGRRVVVQTQFQTLADTRSTDIGIGEQNDLAPFKKKKKKKNLNFYKFTI